MFNDISLTIPLIYAVCLFFAITLLVCYLLFVKEKHVWMKLMLVSVCIVNVGYLYLSLSGNLLHALIGNRIAYLGNAFQPLLMLLTVANLCRIKIKKPVAIALLSFATLMYFGACSMGVSPVFYKTVEYTVVDGVVKLIKTYGFLHTVYTVYVFSFMFAVICMTAYAIFNKKLVFYRYVVMMVLISSTNVAVWIIERFLRGDYEFLSASYVFTNLLMVLLYSELSEHGLHDSFNSVILVKETDATLAVQNTNSTSSTKDQQNTDDVHFSRVSVDFSNKTTLERICQYYSANMILSRRETEILALLLQGFGRKEIAEKLFITTNTVKTHTAKVYSKLVVSSKDDLLKKVAQDVSLINI